MFDRRRLILTLAAGIALPLFGCGGASSIETGIPSNTELPKDFDPGGTAAPDMKGTSKKKASAVP